LIFIQLSKEFAMNITGQCHCGAVSFTALIDPAKVIACHCADCQIFSGAPFRAVVPTPVENVKMTGHVKQYVKIAESGNHRAQVFCGDCGTHLYAAEPDSPKVLNIRLGCVNERALLAPKAQIWGKSTMPWLKTLQAVPHHEAGMASPVMPLL
jgi:hypothetical protein